MPRPFSWRYWGWVEYTSTPLAIWWAHATASSMAWEATDVNDWFEWNGVRCTQYGICLLYTSMGTAAIKASLDFESSFTSVRKTVDATEAEFDALASATKTMSTQVAASTTEINETMALSLIHI